MACILLVYKESLLLYNNQITKAPREVVYIERRNVASLANRILTRLKERQRCTGREVESGLCAKKKKEAEMWRGAPTSTSLRAEHSQERQRPVQAGCVQGGWMQSQVWLPAGALAPCTLDCSMDGGSGRDWGTGGPNGQKDVKFRL